uniref:Lipoyl-binding domain-containing protein n=1 Tax=Meloidogyne incognita TaxID=6306 RepID=A0A914L2Z0_MELIC
MPGIVEKLLVNVGDKVEKNQSLVALNAMKMEYLIRAPFDAIVDSINCSVGQSVPKNFCLVNLKKIDEE